MNQVRLKMVVFKINSIKASKEINNKIEKLNTLKKKKTIESYTNYQFKFVIIAYFNNIISV